MQKRYVHSCRYVQWLVVIAEIKCNDASLTQSLLEGSGYQDKVGGLLIKFPQELHTIIGDIKEIQHQIFVNWKTEMKDGRLA